MTNILAAIVAIGSIATLTLYLFKRYGSRRAKTERLRKELDGLREKQKSHKVGSYHHIILDDKCAEINKQIKLLLMVLICFLLVVGCQAKIVHVPDSKKAISLDAGELTPFAGVLITRGRYDFLLRSEDWFEQRGVNP